MVGNRRSTRCALVLFGLAGGSGCAAPAGATGPAVAAPPTACPEAAPSKAPQQEEAREHLEQTRYALGAALMGSLLDGVLLSDEMVVRMKDGSLRADDLEALTRREIALRDQERQIRRLLAETYRDDAFRERDEMVLPILKAAASVQAQAVAVAREANASGQPTNEVLQQYVDARHDFDDAVRTLQRKAAAP